MDNRRPEPKKRFDPLSPKERSERMSRVRSKDTDVEMIVRRLVHKLGFRYRLHSRKLPGNPDLVFASRKKVIFVHGCFWHLHQDCHQYRLPKSRRAFWLPKLEETRRRDLANQTKLREAGWEVLVVWECELRDADLLSKQIIHFLGGGHS